MKKTLLFMLLLALPVSMAAFDVHLFANGQTDAYKTVQGVKKLTFGASQTTFVDISGTTFTEDNTSFAHMSLQSTAGVKDVIAKDKAIFFDGATVYAPEGSLVEIVNLGGATVARGESTCAVDALAPGAYIVRAVSGANVFTSKIFKKF